MSKNALAAALEPPAPESEVQTQDDVADVSAAGSEPEQKIEGQQQKPEEKDEKEKFVPHGAFHEERERRKELQRQLEEEKRQSAVKHANMERRLQELFQASQQSREQPPQIRDPNTDPDPVGALAHNQQLTIAQVNQLNQHLATEAQKAQRIEYANRVVAWGAARASEFRQSTPDFDAAYEHVSKNRVAELQAMGLSPEQVQVTLKNDEFWVIESAGQNGKNPAEIIYNMAKATGWKPAEAVSAEQKIETLQKGAQAAKTLGNGGGDPGIPTMEQIANMSESEFAALKAKFAKQGKDIMELVSQ